MNSKFDTVNELASELQVKIAQNLSNGDLVNWTQTSQYHLALFKPEIDIRKLLPLLHHVTRGEHDAVEAVLKQDISLIFKRGKVTDCTGREFANISGFEYALWAMDKYMWAKMLTCVPQNDEDKRIFEILIAQYDKVNTLGVTYRLNGQTITEQHFDFENTIIKELQTNVDSLNAPGDKNWDSINDQWREGIGGAQKRLPMHIVDEYCSDERFYPVPKFTSQPKSSKQLYNWVTLKDENWFSVDSRLSVDFAISKVPCGLPTVGAWGHYDRSILLVLDLNAMTALCKIRKNDFIDLKSQLKDLMTPDNHHQVLQI